MISYNEIYFHVMHFFFDCLNMYGFLLCVNRLMTLDPLAVQVTTSGKQYYHQPVNTKN